MRVSFEFTLSILTSIILGAAICRNATPVRSGSDDLLAFDRYRLVSAMLISDTEFTQLGFLTQSSLLSYRLEPPSIHTSAEEARDLARTSTKTNAPYLIFCVLVTTHALNYDLRRCND
jgi:hypothetical protein